MKRSKSTFLLMGIVIILIGLGAFMLFQDGSEIQHSSEESQTATPGTLENDSATSTEERLFSYVEIENSCDHNYEGKPCVKAHAGPGTDFSDVVRLRTGSVYKIGSEEINGGELWHKVTFEDQWLRYPDRLESEWYVADSDVSILQEEGVRTTWENGDASTGKREIIIDKTAQMLYAYEDEELFMQTPISTGLLLSPTPNGTFTVFKKTPSRYMQGPIQGIPGSDYYDLPGVPWNLYFTENGAVIHGAYWHNNFGSRHSHGCVNLPPKEAKRLYKWAVLGTEVVVK